jgi:hypothetical protein
MLLLGDLLFIVLPKVVALCLGVLFEIKFMTESAKS